MIRYKPNIYLPLKFLQLATVNRMCSVMSQVMAKYGEMYGSARVRELLGLDKAALDFSSDAQERKKPVPKGSL